MTESGDPRENAIAERINGILKTEWLYGYRPDSWKEMIVYTGKIIDLYNHRRPHQSIGHMVPEEIHQTGLKTERKWKSHVHVPSKSHITEQFNKKTNSKKQENYGKTDGKNSSGSI
jgi:hypothetical protein